MKRLRMAAFAFALLVASALIVYGFALIFVPSAWIIAGALFALWTWTVLSE